MTMFAEERSWTLRMKTREKKEEITQLVVIRWLAGVFDALDEMVREMILQYTAATIRWRTLCFYGRGLHMKTAMAVVMSLAMLCCVSVNSGHGEENPKTEGFTVTEVTGYIFHRLSEKDTLIQVEVGKTISQDSFISIVKGASLKLKKASGELIIFEGPSEGTLKDLLAEKEAPTREFVKKTLSKIPGVKGDERKVDISTQSAGLTRGAKSPVKSMPYIWKVKKKAEESDKKE